MALQFTPNPRATGNLSLTANSRARMSSVVSIDWDNVTGIPAGVLAVGGVSGTGLLAITTADGIPAVRTITGPAAGITVSNGGGVAGNPTLALANDLAAVEGLASNGMAARTATDTWTVRTITAGAFMGVTNGDGIAGNPTIALTDIELVALAGLTSAADSLPYFTGSGTASLATFTAFARTLVDDATQGAMQTTLGLVPGTNVQAFDADLAALAANSTDGLWTHTGAGTGAARTLTAPAAGITITNPAGIAGNPTLVLANDLAAVEGLAANGIATRTATDTWTVRTITGTAAEITLTNGDGVSGNPTVSLPASITFTGKTITGGSYVTPALGVATATSINGNTFTTGTYTLTGTAGKTFTFSNTLTLSGTDASTLAIGVGGTLTGSSSAAIWYDNIPQNSKSAAYTTVLADAQKHIFHPSADTTARIWTIDSNANVPYIVGTAITFVNQNAGGVITISITSDTMRLAGAGTTGSRSLAANGIATALKVTSTEWLISGTGLT